MKHVSLQAGDTSLSHLTLHFRTGMRSLKQLRFQDFFQLQSSGHILCFSQAIRQAICQAIRQTALPRSQGSSFRGCDTGTALKSPVVIPPSDPRKLGLLGLAVASTTRASAMLGTGWKSPKKPGLPKQPPTFHR